MFPVIDGAAAGWPATIDESAAFHPELLDADVASADQNRRHIIALNMPGPGQVLKKINSREVESEPGISKHHFRK
ncbi:MAG: hypothetical protein WBO37_06850 [Gammaproteobacteria bacterium]